MNEASFFGEKGQCPKKYRNADLSHLYIHPVPLVDYVKIWARNPVSVILKGNYGTGKTFFAFAMIREMFRHCPKRLWPRYYSSPALDSNLLEAIKSDYGDKDYIKDRREEDILFIDDFGRETKSERLKRQYFDILDYRYSAELPTIITTNFSLDQLGDLIDGSLSDRMQEWDLLEFKGESLRK